MFLRLAWQSLLSRKGSSLLTLFAITVSVFVLLGVEQLRHQARNSFGNTVSGVDLIVGARTGNVNLLLYSVFHLGNATNNVRWQSYQSIADNPPNIAVPGAMLTANARHFALEVTGDSMIGAGINDGDVVIIRETGAAENGEIVVAQVEGYEATLKRFRRKGDTIVLEAANPQFEPRVLPVGSVKIQGRLVGLIRTY